MMTNAQIALMAAASSLAGSRELLHGTDRSDFADEVEFMADRFKVYLDKRQNDDWLLNNRMATPSLTDPGVPWCDSCGGPYTDDWLVQGYGGHWDTCPNRTTS